MRKSSIVTAMLLAVVFMSAFAVLPAFAAPPAKYDVGTLVFIDFSADPSHLIQFPGAPSGFDCTDTFSTDWCLKVNCNTISTSTYDCDNAPFKFSCLAFQVSSGTIIKIINVDSDGCK